MDRRKFIGVGAGAIIAMSIPKVSIDSWQERLPSGIWATFTQGKKEWHSVNNSEFLETINSSYKQRGKKYQFGFINDDESKFDRRMESLKFSMNTSIHRLDGKDGILKYPQPSDDNMQTKELAQAWKNHIDEYRTYI